MERPFFWAIPFTVIVAILLIGGMQKADSQQISGTLSLSGAWAIYPLAVKWGDAFQKRHPNVKLDISAGGAGKGMADALTGVVDIGMVSREVDKAEKAKGALPIFIAKDGVFATVSARNPALAKINTQGISIAEFTKTFITGQATTWNQLVTGAPNAPIHIYTRSDACGAASAWAATLGKYKQDNLKGIGVYGDPGLLEAVRRDPLGIGYNNLGYVFTGDTVTPGIALVPIDANGNGKVDANERIVNRDDAYAAVASGRYPGARKEYFVTKGKPSKLALEFIKFALSDEGTKVLKDVGGYVPLSDKEQAAVLKAIQ